MVAELEIKRLRQEMTSGFAELKRIIAGQATIGNWMKQEEACIALGVNARQLRNIRIHLDRHGRKVGSLRWRKGRGKSVEYHKADIENYRNSVTFA